MPCRRHARRDARRTTTRTKESPRMRRFLLGAIATLATVALVTPSWATTTVTETVPRRIESPIEKACPFEVTATDRSEQTARSTYDDTRTLLTRTISGR